MIKCEYCKYWIESMATPLGECRINPPVAQVCNNQVITFWPTTTKDQGCCQGSTRSQSRILSGYITITLGYGCAGGAI